MAGVAWKNLTAVVPGGVGSDGFNVYVSLPGAGISTKCAVTNEVASGPNTWAPVDAGAPARLQQPPCANVE